MKARRLIILSLLCMPILAMGILAYRQFYFETLCTEHQLMWSANAEMKKDLQARVDRALRAAIAFETLKRASGGDFDIPDPKCPECKDRLPIVMAMERATR